MNDPRPQRVLIVEDDRGMRDFYARFFADLRGEDFSVVLVEDTPSALAVLRSETIDLALIDWNLPGIPGDSLLRAMREHPKTRSIGVMMITGRLSAEDEIHALDSGADDYLTKPVDEATLLSRLRSLRRRRERSLERRGGRPYPGLDYDLTTGVVRVEGQAVSLTPKEMGLLWIVLNQPDSPHSRKELCESLWGYRSENSEAVLDATAYSLKRKLGEEWGGRLKRIGGEGYAYESPN